MKIFNRNLFLRLILVLIVILLISFVSERIAKNEINSNRSNVDKNVTSIPHSTKKYNISKFKILSQQDLDLRLLSLGDGEISNNLKIKRDFIREMMKSCWKAYVEVAFGQNEVNINSRKPYNSPIFESIRGITIIDSIDTLFLFGLYDEYIVAKQWISSELNFIESNMINLFETNIRVFGGLLSAHFLTSDDIFLEKALVYGELTIPSFSSIFPPHRINFRKNTTKYSVSVCNLAEIGTLYLEYAVLSGLTGNDIYLENVKAIRNSLKDIFFRNNKRPLSNKYYTDGKIMNIEYTIGGGADSFYEYLIKGSVLDKNDLDSLNFFKESLDSLNSYILKKTAQNRTYYGSYVGRFFEEMEHLACFTGGMYALASENINDEKLSQKYLAIGKEITETCYLSCFNTKTGLCPEKFYPNNIDSQYHRNMREPYLLRPELMESLFYMYRVTGNPIYQERGWYLINKIYEHTKVEEFGHSSVNDVNQIPTEKSGIQESFFMAETLKYAYLLFSSKDFIPIDKWVFNTEAHPFKTYQ